MRISSAAHCAIGPALALVAVWALGCSEDSSAGCARKVVTSAQGCQISADCAAAGLDLSCVDGTCRLTCRSDADCDLIANADPTDDPECRADPATTPAAICQAGICEIGCPDQPCSEGEMCFDGRCVLYAEGFEVPEGAQGVDLRLLGFNDPPLALPNGRTKILWSGPSGCVPAVDFNCSGPAGQGERFVVVESEPTPPKGTPVTGTTCRACACCLECLANPPSNPVSLASCPATPNIPTPIACFENEPSCAAVCTACDACPDAQRTTVATNPLLIDCEKTAASRRCSLCDACDSFLAACQVAECPECATAPSSEACRTCTETVCLSNPRCTDCLTCANAQNCSRNDPGSAECNAFNDACDDQGEEGCFDVPIDYLRGQLTDEEQALTSPPVDLSGVTGDVVLQLDYVAFDVGASYFPGIQGTPPEDWVEAPQAVRLQFCGAASCGPAAWSDAALTLPADSQRANGRLLGDQTLVDWRANRVTVNVPVDVRTATFRYRFLPALADGARVGIDSIIIRRGQP